MSEHSDLVAEISNVEKMTTPERLKHAKKRRSQQLKRFANYEKQLEKDKNKKNKQSQNQKRTRKRARVKFIHNIMLLEASARNDVEEGKFKIFCFFFSFLNIFHLSQWLSVTH
jgi:protein phosphatase 1 regulatory subunit 16A